jgi:hypothetical protein
LTRKIPTYGMGLEISEQAVQSATTLDLVGSGACAVRQQVQRNERANGYILSNAQRRHRQWLSWPCRAISGKVGQRFDPRPGS